MIGKGLARLGQPHFRTLHTNLQLLPLRRIAQLHRPIRTPLKPRKYKKDAFVALDAAVALQKFDVACTLERKRLDVLM